MRRWLLVLAGALGLCVGGSGPVRAEAGRDPATASIAAIRDHLATHRGRQGGRPISVTRHFRALGEPAVTPMLSRLARAPLPGADLPAAARTSLRVGLIEAVGMRRDPRARPVLLALLARDAAQAAVDRAAAEALARLGDDETADRLLELARTDGPKRLAVLATIGQCRRAAIADGLAEMVAAPHPPEVRLLLIRALGAVGNAWAWQTPIIRASGEEREVRATAARALLDVFIASDGAQRVAAQQGLLLVDHPRGAELVEAARDSAPTEVRAALDRLLYKLRHSPLHRRR